MKYNITYLLLSMDETDKADGDVQVCRSGASIPIYRWRQMRHGQFWGEWKKINFGGNEKV